MSSLGGKARRYTSLDLYMPRRAERTTIVAKPTPDPEALAGLRLQESDERLAGRSRIASGALVLVLLSVSVFAVWTSQATSTAASRAAAANHLSDHYAQASSAVAAEESLERKYHFEPGPETRTSYDAATAGLVAVLGHVRQDGDAGDRVFVDRVLAQHRDYLAATGRMFAAVDRGDTATVLLIDNREVHPLFVGIQKAVVAAAGNQHQIALAELANLQRLENLSRQLTPVVFLVGLAIAALLGSITRGHRRLLVVERARAVHDSLHDALTGLPNRTLLADRLERALRADARMGTSTGLLLLDLVRK